MLSFCKFIFLPVPDASDVAVPLPVIKIGSNT